jgi:hypothetical protein
MNIDGKWAQMFVTVMSIEQGSGHGGILEGAVRYIEDQGRQY